MPLVLSPHASKKVRAPTYTYAPCQDGSREPVSSKKRKHIAAQRYNICISICTCAPVKQGHCCRDAQSASVSVLLYQYSNQSLAKREGHCCRDAQSQTNKDVSTAYTLLYYCFTTALLQRCAECMGGDGGGKVTESTQNNLSCIGATFCKNMRVHV